MTNYKKINELMYLTQRAWNTGHYGRAEKLFRKLLQEAFESGDYKIIASIATAFMDFRQARATEALQVLKRIDPIQSQRKELS